MFPLPCITRPKYATVKHLTPDLHAPKIFRPLALSCQALHTVDTIRYICHDEYIPTGSGDRVIDRETISRRGFITLAAKSAAIALLPVPALGHADQYSHFDPRRTYGDFIAFSRGSDPMLVHSEMHAQIQRCVPPQYRSRIEYVCFQPRTSDPLAQCGTVGWKYPGLPA